MIEQAIRIIKTEQQRTDQRAVALIPKAAHDAIGGAQRLDFEHGTFA